MELLRSFFENATAVIRSANPSVYSFVETTLPYSTPVPIAVITMASAASYFGLKGLGAFLFVYSLEGIGLLATTKFIESVINVIRSRNIKVLLMTILLLFIVIAYISILVTINVTIHQEFDDPGYSLALTLICFLPLIAGTLNGITLVFANDRMVAQEQKDLAERRYQEKRQDRKDRWNLVHGIISSPPDSSDEKKVPSDKMPGDFREYVFQVLDERDGNIGLVEITELVNKNKRVHFIHNDCKGTWGKYKRQWLRDHGRE